MSNIVYGPQSWIDIYQPRSFIM